MRDRFISPQVQILLARMDMHPDEFCKALSVSHTLFGSKWDFLFSAGEFTLLEKYLLRRKMKAIRRKVTQEQIMLTIMGDESFPEEMIAPMTISTTSRFNQSKKP